MKKNPLLTKQVFPLKETPELYIYHSISFHPKPSYLLTSQYTPLIYYTMYTYNVNVYVPNICM